MDKVDDWDEGDSFCFWILESLGESGVWGEFSLLVEGWGIFANWILSKDCIASSWLMFRDEALMLELFFLLGRVVGFSLRKENFGLISKFHLVNFILVKGWRKGGWAVLGVEVTVLA